MKSHGDRSEFYIIYIRLEEIWLHLRPAKKLPTRDMRLKHGLNELGLKEGEKQPIFRWVTCLKGNVEIADGRGLGIEP